MKNPNDQRSDANCRGTVIPVNGLERLGSIHVSFRGSLAGNVARLRSEGRFEVADSYVRGLITSGEPDLVRVNDGTMLIIGLASERGQFPPDW